MIDLFSLITYIGIVSSSFQVTVGASFLSQTVALQDSTTVKFEIWDTAGQERYGPLQLVVYLFLLFLIANFIIIDSWDYMTKCLLPRPTSIG